MLPGRCQCKSLPDLLWIVLDHLRVNIYPDLRHSQLALYEPEDRFALEVYEYGQIYNRLSKSVHSKTHKDL